jgi:catechol 2,3-dioxygenase-like lactoylglutathione lyase family enzyme
MPAPQHRERQGIQISRPGGTSLSSSSSFLPAAGPAYWSTSSSDLFLGIDHSALSVSDVEASLGFYRAFGLRVAARTLNHGAEQARLDGIVDPQVDVIALEPPTATPHVELLHYRTTAPRHPVTLHSNDLAATRLVMEAVGDLDSNSCGSLLRDPDGHLLELR